MKVKKGPACVGMGITGQLQLTNVLQAEQNGSQLIQKPSNGLVVNCPFDCHSSVLHKIPWILHINTTRSERAGET